MSDDFRFDNGNEFFVALDTFLEGCARNTLKYPQTFSGRGKQPHLTVRALIVRDFDANVARRLSRLKHGERLDRDILDAILVCYRDHNPPVDYLLRLHLEDDARKRLSNDAKVNPRVGTYNVNKRDIPMYMQRICDDYGLDHASANDAAEFQRVVYEALEVACFGGRIREGMRNAHVLERVLVSSELCSEFLGQLSAERIHAYRAMVIRYAGWAAKTAGDHRNFQKWFRLAATLKTGVDQEANVCLSSLAYHNQVAYGSISQNANLAFAQSNYKMSQAAADFSFFNTRDVGFAISANLACGYIDAGAGLEFIVPELNERIGSALQRSIESEMALSSSIKIPTHNEMRGRTHIALAKLNTGDVKQALIECDQVLCLMDAAPHLELARAYCLSVKGKAIAQTTGPHDSFETKQARDIYLRLGHRKLASELSARLAA